MLERIHVSPREFLLDDAHMPFTFDGTMCTLRQPNGEVRVWETDICGEKPFYKVFQGPAENPLERRLDAFEWDYNGYEHRWPSDLWLQNFYVCDDGAFIGFVHREDLNGNNDAGTNNFWTGLAISEDGGKRWKYLGDILGTFMNWKLKDVEPNMGGVPFIVHDGYFYVYFNEYVTGSRRYISAARFSVEETMRCAKEGKLPEVRKFDGEGWTADPIHDPGAMIVPGSDDGCMDSHADAAWCEPLGRYLMTVQTHALGKLWMYLSEDGVHWDERVLLNDEQSDAYMHPYSTFVGLEGANRDFTSVGSHFYVFFPRKTFADYHHDEWYRVEVTIDPA